MGDFQGSPIQCRTPQELCTVKSSQLFSPSFSPGDIGLKDQVCSLRMNYVEPFTEADLQPFYCVCAVC